MGLVSQSVPPVALVFFLLSALPFFSYVSSQLASREGTFYQFSGPVPICTLARINSGKGSFCSLWRTWLLVLVLPAPRHLPKAASSPAAQKAKEQGRALESKRLRQQHHRREVVVMEVTVTSERSDVLTSDRALQGEGC